MTLGNMRAKSFIALLALTPLYLAFDCLSQHMRATVKFLQHIIGASECSHFYSQIDGF